MGKTVNFGFNADALPSGHLNYKDKEQNIHLVSDAITTFTQTGPNSVMFTGRGRVGSQMVEFTVWIEDNGEPGTNDYFKIVITGGVASTREGRLTTGNIQFHR